MARDYYKEAASLAVEASRLGFPEIAERVTRAIGDGYTATEILMRCDRYCVKRCLRSRDPRCGRTPCR